MNLTRTLLIGLTTIALLASMAPTATAGTVSDTTEAAVGKAHDMLNNPIRECQQKGAPICSILFGDLDGACSFYMDSDLCRKI